jgi:hypothetical protein
MLFELKATPAEYKAGLDRAIAEGWLELHMWTAPDLQGLALAACSDRLRSYVRPVFGSFDHRPRWASRTVRSKHESGIFCR